MDGARSGRRRASRSPFIGKIKTVSQMVAIPLLLYHDQLLGVDCQWLGTVLIYVAAVLTVIVDGLLPAQGAAVRRAVRELTRL